MAFTFEWRVRGISCLMFIEEGIFVSDGCKSSQLPCSRDFEPTHKACLLLKALYENINQTVTPTNLSITRECTP